MRTTVPANTAVLLLLGLSLPATAQQLTAEEVLTPNNIGYRYVGLDGPIIPWDSIPAGVYAVWNYAEMVIDANEQLQVTAIAPLDIPGTTVFNNADHVLRTEILGTGQTIYSIYDQQADRLLNTGTLAPNTITVLTDPSIALGLPMTLGDTIQEPWCSTFSDTLGGPDYFYCGNSYVTFDLVGTLITPFGTYPNCKHVTRKRSSLWLTEIPQDSTFVVEQLWYTPGITQPVLALELTINSSTSIFVSGRVIDTGAITRVDEEELGPLRIGPNPTSGTIWMDLQDRDVRTIEVVDAEGRRVLPLLAGKGAQRPVLDLTSLAEGVYTIRVNLVDRVMSRTVVKRM